MNKEQERRAAIRRAAGLPEPDAFADEFIDEPLALEVFRAARDDHPLRKRLTAALLYSYIGDVSRPFGSGLNALVSDAIFWAKDAGWFAHRASISPKVRTLVYRRDGYACVQCGNDLISELTIDHRHPIAAGGTDDVNNLRTSCRSCNSRKGARL
jgi:hypothetical protein